MIRHLIFALWFISLAESYSLSPIYVDPNNFPKSDLILYDFRREFHSSYPYRCLLQIESKYFYVSRSCQLLTRTSLKQICSFNTTIKLEVVFPQNTTVYEVTVASSQSNCTRSQSCLFERNPYRIRLKENGIFKNFLQVKTFSTCAPSNYLLSSTNSKKNFDYFSLNSTSGYLSLLHPLDYESVTTWKLVIQGHDTHHIPFYTYVIIDVDDVNDCPPLLSWNFPLQIVHVVNDTDSFNIEVSIAESNAQQKNIIIANLIASDIDSPLKFDLRISAAEYLPFSIDGPYGDTTYVLLTSHKLDREYRDKYVVGLIISDSGQPLLTSHYRLTVNVLDSNDNPPRFDQDVYYVDIQENNFVNTTLLQIFANDSDLNENARIAYELGDGANEYVWIDNLTGIIRTKIHYDYEVTKNFSFTVIAKDHPKNDPQLSATALVIVNVIDQNDNIPKFPQSTYEFTIHENNIPHSYIGEVTAIDFDDALLAYSFDNSSNNASSLFYISSDGRIYALKSLDREQVDEYTFYVIASDGFHTSMHARIHIEVLDLNDEVPRFIFPNDYNDTLIIDRAYWNKNNYICQIEIQDNDQIKTHTLLLIYRLDQLNNYDYLLRHKAVFHFDSEKFFLDENERLFFNSTNDTIPSEGVYYVAFKVVDGQKYYEEKLLKLIVVNDYENVGDVIKQYDYLGPHLNNRMAHLKQIRTKSTFSSSSLDRSNKYLLLIIFAILAITLVAITLIFISLVRRKTLKQKEFLKQNNSMSLSLSRPAVNTKLHPLKPLTHKIQKKTNLHVDNCFDYHDSSLLMFNKDSLTPSINNDKCCLLEKLNEKELYDRQSNQTYSSWVLSKLNYPESHYSQKTIDSPKFHSFNHLSVASTSNLSNESCSHRRSSISQTPNEYASGNGSSSVSNSAHTPVSSDDGFCGSSDVSDPSLSAGNTHLLSSYRQACLIMKDNTINKNNHTSSFTSLTNGIDATRRVRFKLGSEEKRTLSPSHSSDHTLRQYEQTYTNRNHILENKSFNSTVV